MKTGNRMVMWLLLAVSTCLLLAACAKNNGDAPAGGAGDAGSAAQGAAKADLKCPPKVRELAGPDILGIKLGMSYAEALATAQCALGADAPVKSEKTWFEHLDTQGVELGPQYFVMKQGNFRPCNYAREWQKCEGANFWEHVDEAIYVAAPGAPGKEQVVAVWRSQYFPEGKRPTVDATLAALKSKYGQPQRSEDYEASSKFSGESGLEWVQAPDGTPLADPNPLFRQCLDSISGEADGQADVHWHEGCGLNVSATLNRDRGNPALVAELHVRMERQDAMVAQQHATEDELRRLGDARRAAEVKQAGDASNVRL